MDSLVCDLELLKISALQKLHIINSRYVREEDPKPEETKKSSPKRNEEYSEVLSAPNSENKIDNVIKTLETQRQEEVRNRVQARIGEFENFTKRQELNTQQQWLKIQQNFIQDTQQKENNIFQAMHDYDQNTTNSHAKLAQYYHNLHLRRLAHEQELKKRERQKQIMHACIDKIRKHQQDFSAVYHEIMPTLKKCSQNDELKTKLSDHLKLLKVLPGNFEKIIDKCRSEIVSEDDERLAAQTLEMLKDVKRQIEDIVTQTLKTNETVDNSKEIIVSKPSAVPEQSPAAVTQSTPTKKEPVSAENKPQQAKAADASSIMRYISLANLKMYTEISDFLDKHTESFKSLQDDASQKQFKFDCKKAINIPVNSLSGVNSDHMLDKYNKLKWLLSGQDIVVSDKRINASRHPQGIAFCLDLLAQKFVLQGDLMVSSNPESAFCYASVMASLWNDFPIFGHLLLGHFYKSCPYLVPYCIPRQVGESDEEFYTKQGYQYKDGQIEKQDKFLKRMTGIMRLYAAIMVVKPKKGQNGSPHSIRNGWRWLSSQLKLEPQVDITATMLHTFLETAGFEMEARYGRAFQKLVMILVNNFLPDCRKQCTGGAVTRLELLLTEYFKNKKFEKPNGYLESSYW
ncbi:hypothetical protein JTB14_031722 [Gonioctena quinquepunctata]|nr:hypothetical protein JTB14_031722 [Gonioctena quinquepunctata]